MNSIKTIVITVLFIFSCKLALAADNYSYYWGTGTYISNNGYILTDAHVITDDGKTVRVITVYDHGIWYSAHQVTTSLQNDLSLIKLDKAITTPCLQIANTGVSKYVPYYILQFDLSDYSTWPVYKIYLAPVQYTYLNYSSRPNDAKYIGTHLTDAAYETTINGGNSGSPVLNLQGQIMDVVWGGSDKTPKTIASTPNQLIHSLVDKYKLSCTPTTDDKSTLVLIKVG